MPEIGKAHNLANFSLVTFLEEFFKNFTNNSEINAINGFFDMHTVFKRKS